MLSYIIKCFLWQFFFILLNIKYYIDFCNVELCLLSWDQSHFCSWCIIFLICCYILFANILLMILHLYLKGILSVVYLFVMSLCGVVIRIILASSNEWWGVFSYFWKSFKKISVNYSFNVWQNLPIKPHSPRFFFVGGFWLLI